MNNFKYSMSLLNTMFGITIQEDDFEEIASVGWNMIGNKRMRIYRYSTCVDECQDGVELPCNVDQLEAVTTDWEDWNYSTNDTPNGNIYSAFVESYIEHRKAFRDPLYASGKFINYERVGDKIYFDRPYGKINILYRGLQLDDDGLPEITDKEALAIATFCAYTIKYKEGLATNNANVVAFAENLRQQWLIRADQARNDYYMSQNEWNQVLEAKTSWNRKSHSRSFKMYE